MLFCSKHRGRHRQTGETGGDENLMGSSIAEIPNLIERAFPHRMSCTVLTCGQDLVTACYQILLNDVSTWKRLFVHGKIKGFKEREHTRFYNIT